ncbi:hypothetical protein NS274_06570 [Pseudomonas oryzihabitans]|nr:hypothetical protein NS274_06570 [Pseudomonas psychrotolerans]KTT29920.1 hypothetical protein NS201_14775 [Pseudomonas psychrotolerans]KTT35334.1 hypothetical protein SB9_09720 [Pseudomonas psychrotolerans]KTT38962.1 hypothetical protein SB5_14530 [Pseudomonas psychrotolerans]KTT44152.1 hypothetical protein RSA46_13400 [Pseudomonas psychrotolerans]
MLTDAFVFIEVLPFFSAMHFQIFVLRGNTLKGFEGTACVQRMICPASNYIRRNFDVLKLWKFGFPVVIEHWMVGHCGSYVLNPTL